MWDGRLGDRKGGFDVDVHGPFELFLGGGQNVPIQHDAGVVHHAVES